jgi:hypothetical protein
MTLTAHVAASMEQVNAAVGAGDLPCQPAGRANRRRLRYAE